MFSHSSRRLKLERLEDRLLPALTIIPTFAANIRNDPNAAAIESTINQAISIYEGYIADPITVNITYQEMSGGLGENETFFVEETYSSYLAALQAQATSAADATALAGLPAGTSNPVNTGAMIDLRSPLARALGYSDASNANIPMDSTISVNTSICNLTRPDSNRHDFDLQAVVMHEMDEALGGGSALDGSNQNAPAPATIDPLDLYRYASPGVRSFNTAAPTGAANQAYFSIDGGVTDLVNFNQEATGDFGDWYSFPFGALTPPGPEVQDAFATPGAAPNLGVELTRLDVEGFSLTTTPTMAFTSAPSIVIANMKNVSVSGTGADGDAISVTITDGTNTTTPAITTVNDGTWSVSGIDASDLADGTVTYLATETDANGDAGLVKQTAKKLTVPPEVAFTSTPNINIASKGVVSVSGTGDDGDTISLAVTDGTNTKTATTTVSNGAWTVSNINVSTLADGTVTYVAAETDALGNTTTIMQTAAKITAAPKVAFTSTPAVNIANESTISVSGTGTNGDMISVVITEGADTTTPATTTVSNGAWSVSGINASGLADGTVSYSVTETDPAGNTVSVTQTARKLTVAPDVAFTSTTNIDIADAGSIAVRGTGDKGDTISVTITDGTYTTTAATTTVGNGAWSVGGINAAGLSDGTVSYFVTETDSAGNTTTISQAATKITVAPVIAFSSTPNIGSANVSSVSVSGTGDNGDTISVVIIEGTRTTAAATTTVGDGAWSVSDINASGLATGTVSYVATETDPAGNTTTIRQSATKFATKNVPTIVNASMANLPISATTFVIHGSGFDPHFANDFVALSSGSGSVTAASATALTVRVSGLTVGPLFAVVTADGIASDNTRVATVIPMVTKSSVLLAANATSLIINGFGFDPTPANDVVSFSGGVTGTVSSAMSNQLIVSDLNGLEFGSLTASVTVDGQSSGTSVQVARVTPVVTASTADLAANATSLIIQGFGFSNIAAGITVKFSGGATGKVTSALPAQLTITHLSGLVAGNLTATVTAGGLSSAAVQVATVEPVVTMSTANLAASATSVVIHGSGFSSIAADNTVTFSDGATGKVTHATATTLTVTGLSGTTPGSLAVSVTSNGVNSGEAVQVATVLIAAPKVVASIVSPTEINLSWNAVVGAQAYEVEQLQSNGTWSLLFTLDADTTSQLVSVPAGSTDTFRVGATFEEDTAFSSRVVVKA